MTLVSKSFSDIVTFSRSSNATRVGPTGLVEYAPHNLLQRSQEFDNAYWIKNLLTVSANSVAAPDGTITADKIVETAAGGDYHGLIDNVSLAAQVYTLSVYAKKAERNFLFIRFGNINNKNCWFNLDTGVVGTVDSGITASISSVGNGWYRCVATITSVSTSGVTIGLSNSNGTLTYTGDGTSGIYIWGAQLAVGPYALDYTPTTSAAVYGPRFDYDPSGVTIIDPVSRNLLTYSEQFDNAAWTKRSIALTGSQSAPNGSSTAFLAVPSTATFADMYIAASGSSAMYTVSFFAKASGKNWIYLLSAQGASANWAWFNLTNGVVGTTNGAGLSATITSAGNGWYRCTVSQESVSNYVQIGISDADGSVSVTGSGSNGVFIWGAQIEVGSQATSYMVSGATNGFRAVPVTSGTATARGLLVEEQRTNSFTYSQLFSNAAWLKDRSSVTLSGSAPDGTVSAFLLAEDTTAANDHYIKYAASAFSANTWTLSVFAKKSTRSAIGLRMLAGSSDYVTVVFNLDTGLETKRQSAGGFSAINATSTAFGNGWYRLTLTATAAGGFDASFLISNSTTPTIGVFGEIAYNGDGSSGVLIWGSQIENGSFATSLIPTLASTVTRSADLASVDTLTPWMNQTEGTIFAEYLFYGADAAYNNTVVMLTDGTENNYETIFGHNPAYGWVQSGGATSAGMSSGGSTAINTNYKAALAFKANDFAFSLNGGAAVTDTSGTVPTVTQMLLGRRVSASKPLHGYLRRVAFFPRRLSNAELQALTA